MSLFFIQVNAAESDLRALNAEELLAKVQASIDNEKPSQALPFIAPLLSQTKTRQHAHMMGEAYYAAADVKSMLGDFQSAIIYFDTAIKNLDSNFELLAKAYLGRGSAKEQIAQYASALVDYEQSLELHLKLDDDSALASSYNNLGNIYGKFTQYEKALRYYQQGLEIKKRLKDPAGIGGSLNNIGNIYSRIDQPKKALEFYQDALNYMQKADKKLYLEIILGNIGSVYQDLGEYEKGIEYIQKSLKIAEEIEDQQGLAIGFHNLAHTYSKQNKKEQAKQFYKKALTIERKIGDRKSEGDTLTNLAVIYFEENDIAKSKDLLQQAEDIANSIQDLPMMESIEQHRVSLFEQQGDFKSALNSLKKYNEIKAQKSSQQLNERLAQLKSGYDFDKETLARKLELKELKQLQKEQLLAAEKDRYFKFLLIAIGIILAVSLSFFFFAFHRTKEYARKLKKMSFQDPLTELGNRRSLKVSLQTAIPDVDRCYNHHRASVADLENRDLIFILIDLDHFKKVNDQYGHEAGDTVLKQMKAIIQPLMRETDPIVRWGGEEFLIVARNSKRSLAHQMTERIRKQIEAHEFAIDRRTKIKLTCSIGFACYPFFQQHPTSVGWEQIVNIADTALYYSKNHGRNAWTGYLATDHWFNESPEKDIESDIENLIDMQAIECQTSVKKHGKDSN